MSPASIHSLVEQVRPVYDLARLRAGHRLLLRHLGDRLLRLEYDIDDEEFLVVEAQPDGYHASRQSAPRGSTRRPLPQRTGR